MDFIFGFFRAFVEGKFSSRKTFDISLVNGDELNFISRREELSTWVYLEDPFIVGRTSLAQIPQCHGARTLK